MPLVSVIIPTFNGAATIAETIASVLAQSLSNIEVIVVDDGSIDETAETVNSIAASNRTVRLIQKRNGGVASARNAGLLQTSPDSEYVMFLDHDDLLEPNALEILNEALSLRQDAVGIHGQAKVISADGTVLPDAYWIQPTLVRRRLSCSGRFAIPTSILCDDKDDTTQETLLFGNCIATPGQALFRRQSLPEKAFDALVEPADDWDLYIRLAKNSVIAYLPAVVVGWRQHERNQTGDSHAVRGAHRRLHEKWIKDAASRFDRRLLIRQYFYTALALTAACCSSRKLHRLHDDAIPAIKLLLLAVSSAFLSYAST